MDDYGQYMSIFMAGSVTNYYGPLLVDRDRSIRNQIKNHPIWDLQHLHHGLAINIISSRQSK